MGMATQPGCCCGGNGNGTCCSCMGLNTSYTLKIIYPPFVLPADNTVRMTYFNGNIFANTGIPINCNSCFSNSVLNGYWGVGNQYNISNTLVSYFWCLVDCATCTLSFCDTAVNTNANIGCGTAGNSVSRTCSPFNSHWHTGNSVTTNTDFYMS